MALLEKLTTEPDEWNYPSRPKWLLGLGAGLGVMVGTVLSQLLGGSGSITPLVVGVSAATGALLGYALAAALD